MKKLKVPEVYGQRDNRWNNILLGYNSNSQYTIGLYGCLISCLGMIVHKTPDEVNTILKNNSGFVSGSGDFYWGKCSALGLNQIYTSPSYDGPVTPQGMTKIKELLDDNHPLLCEIDFNPATTSVEEHYVLLIGYDGDQIIAADPWTGQIISLDVYGGAQRSIIQFRSYDKTFDDEADSQVALLEREYAQCRNDRDGHWIELQTLKQQYGDLDTKFTLLTGDKERISRELDQSLKNTSELRDVTNKQIDALSQQLENETANLTTANDKIKELTTQLNATDIGSILTENEGLKIRIGELTDELAKRPKLKKIWKLGKSGLLIGLLDDKSPANVG